MKRQVIVSHITGVGHVVTLGIEGMVTKEMHQELALFAPSLVAAIGHMTARAWYDDEDHSITIQREMTAPPRR